LDTVSTRRVGGGRTIEYFVERDLCCGAKCFKARAVGSEVDLVVEANQRVT